MIPYRKSSFRMFISAASLAFALVAVSGIAHAETHFDVLKAFDAAAQSPVAPLIQGVDGNFYGTTSQGGAAGTGTVFQVTLAGAFTVLYTFTGGTDGDYPYAGVIQGADGNFYGTTYQGGASGAGTVFRLTPAGAITVLYAFTGGADGAYPYGGVILGTDGNLYGTASQGGAANAGIVFQLTPDGRLTALHASAGGATDGTYPLGGLIQGSDGNFYGTTLSGGGADGGTVFQVTPAGTTSILYAFTGANDGAYPYAGVIQASDGNFYGTSQSGGAFGAGTAFRLTTKPSPITWNTPASIVYGTPLGDAQLNATASVPGVFTYTPPAGTVLHAGSQTLTVSFTPTDTTLPPTTWTVTLTVTQATPVVTWTPPAPIVYGTPLSSTQLRARANVEGTFTYDPPAGAVLAVGSPTLSATLTVAIAGRLAGGNGSPVPFSSASGARGLVVAGYALAADPVRGTIVVGNCSYYTVRSGSGRGGGYRTITPYYNQTCTWDPYGNLLNVASGAPTIPGPIAIKGTQTIYAANQGIYTGTDSALPGGGFVYTSGSHYSWLTPNPYAVIQQALYTVTVTLKSDGDIPLTVSSVQASALAGQASVTSTTCSGQIAIGSTCSATVTYDPTRLRSATGLAYDTLDIHVNSDAGRTLDFVQRYTIVLTPSNTTDDD